MLPTDRLQLGILKGRIIRALGKMRAACEQLNLEQASAAEQEMNEGLDELCKRLRVG
jgi:hypothetical protein